MDEEILPDDSIFDDVVEDDSICSNTLLEDSFSSCLGDAPASSTPLRSRGRGRGRVRGARGASSSAAARTAKDCRDRLPRLPCPKCPNTYANERTLSVHLKMHAMKSVSSRNPTAEELGDIVLAELPVVLTEMSKGVEFGELSKKLNLYCIKVINLFDYMDPTTAPIIAAFIKTLYNIIRQENCLLPSAYRSSAYCHVNKALNSTDFMSEMKNLFLSAVDETDHVLNIFIGRVTMKLLDKVIVAVLRKMRGSSNEPASIHQKRSQDEFQSEDFKQIVYYIGGSVVNGLMWKGKKVDASERWKLYGDILRCKFLQQTVMASECGGAEEEIECSASISSFTTLKSRGSLKLLNMQAFEFFSVVFSLIICMEGSDGSIPRDLVDEHVLKSDSVLLLWDDLVGSELTEDYSIFLLDKTVTSCAAIVSKGVLKRRLNEELKAAFSSVALRSRLAR